jgi:serine/threonine protein kinase
MLLKQADTDRELIWRKVSSLTKTGAIEKGDLQGCLNPQADCPEAVLNLIKNMDPDFSEVFSCYETGRTRNTLQVFPLPGDGRSVVLKKNSGRSAGLAWPRKGEVFLRNIFKNYARTAFQGSLALHIAGIPTPKPLAWWSKGGWRAKDSYFIYEEIAAKETLSKYLQKIWDENGEPAAKEASDLISAMAHVTRKMHEAGIRHGDIVTHNFLVCQNNSYLALIDTDHVRPGNGFLPETVRKFLNLRCLRRLDLSLHGQRYFLSRYYDREVRWGEWLAFRFWYLGGFGFRRWIKRFRKYLSGNSRKQPADVPWWYPH